MMQCKLSLLRMFLMKISHLLPLCMLFNSNVINQFSTLVCLLLPSYRFLRLNLYVYVHVIKIYLFCSKYILIIVIYKLKKSTYLYKISLNMKLIIAWSFKQILIYQLIRLISFDYKLLLCQ